MEQIDQLKREAEAEAVKVRAEAAALLEGLKTEAKGGFSWKLAGLVLFALCAAVYLCWSLVRTPAPKLGVFTLPAPAVMEPKVVGPTLKVPLMVVPKHAVEKKFPTLGPIPLQTEVVDTADIPPTENGVQTVTFMNMTTGSATTQYVVKPAPWFALEAKNAVGVALLETTRGVAGAIYYRRDIARVKDFHLSGIAGIGVVAGSVVPGVGVTGEWR